MLLSIIIPVYNSAPYICRCFDSLLPQISTTDDVEIICVNDGSTDNSLEICYDYAKKYSHIHVYTKNNGGVASARNLGLKQATGDYIAWIDPDDYVSTNWFKRIRALLLKNHPDWLMLNYSMDDYGIIKPQKTGLKGNITREQLIYELSSDMKLKSGMVLKVILSKLYKGLQFDENAIIFEDYKITTELALKAKKIVALDDCLYFYVRHHTSLVNQVSMMKRLIAAKIARERFMKFSQKGYIVSKAGYWKMALLVCLTNSPKRMTNTADDLQSKLVYKNELRRDLFRILRSKDAGMKLKFALLLNLLLPEAISIALWNRVRNSRYK